MDLLARLRATPPFVQIAAAAATAVVLALLLTASYLLWFRSPYRVLFSDLRQADAATVVAELEKRKIAYQLQDGGATILVPGKIADSTRLSLASENLPLKGVVGFEIFNKSDMGLTEFAQQINYHRALQGELERTIMELDGVEAARVHLTIAEPSIFRNDRRPSKASVTVIPRLDRVLPPETIRGVQQLVAAAVPELAPGDVVVLDAHGAVVSGEAVAAADAAGQTPKDLIEAYYAERIRRALRPLDPAGAVVVAVTVRPPLNSGGRDPLTGWTPPQRSFPIAVALTLPAGEPRASRIRDLAVQAADLEPSRGDGLMLAYAGPPRLAAPPAAHPAARAAGPERLLASPRRFWLVLLAPALVLGLAALAGVRALERPRRLDRRRQELYAQRLTALLDREDGDAAAAR